MKNINVDSDLGWMLLAIWLIAKGVLGLVAIGGATLGLLLDLLALAAGVVLLMGMPGGKLTSKLSYLLPGIWLLATGLIGLINLSFMSMGLIMAVLAIAAGAAMLLTLEGRAANNIGVILAGGWFLLTGLFSLISFSFSGLGLVMSLLAIAAGILLLLGK